jgi:putative serine protease PepD
MAIGVANDLIESGVVNHALLGIQGRTVYAEQDGAEYPVGVVVTDVATASAYDEAGGQVNDVITAIDGVPITTMDTLLTILRSRRAGEAVTVAVTRSEASVDLNISLGTQ